MSFFAFPSVLLAPRTSPALIALAIRILIRLTPYPHSRQPKDFIDFLKEKFEVRDSNAEFRIPNNQIQVFVK